MRSRYFVVVAVIAFALVGRANAQQEQTVDPALKQAADARTTARDSADGDTYGRYTLEDAWLMAPDGGLLVTQQNVDALGPNDGGGLINPRVSEDRYRIFRDSAIRTYRRGAEYQGQQYAWRFLESWVKEGGEWKLAAEWYREIVEK